MCGMLLGGDSNSRGEQPMTKNQGYPGYYSLIQFMPCPSRAEAINVGVVLSCSYFEYLGTNTIPDSHIAKTAERLVGRGNVDKALLIAAKNAIVHGLYEVVSFDNPYSFRQFAATRTGILRLTLPRSVKVFEPRQEIQRLFDELVF